MAKRLSFTRKVRYSGGWLVLGLLLAMALPVAAQKAKDGKDALDKLAFASPVTWTTFQADDMSRAASFVPSATLQAFDAFRARTGAEWTMAFDRVTGKPLLVEGGTPWIPGTGQGNLLRAADLGVTDDEAAQNRIPVEIVAAKALDFLGAYPALFGVDTGDLTLMRGASGPVLDYLYYVDFQWNYHGIPVENAHVVFRLNSGNLVQFGQEYVCDTVKNLDPRPDLDRKTAWEILWGYVGGARLDDQVLEPGRLLIQPVSNPAMANGLAFAPGAGLEYRLVYVLAFRRPGVLGTWEARVDAHTGEILSFKDENKYGHIQGGVYKTDKNPTQTEVTMPFPYANYSGTTSYADIAGNFPGTTGTSTMRGRTGSAGNVGGVTISDTCGAISKAADATGLIDFSSSAGTDCTVPASGGGAGNSHASRTQYYNVTQIKIKAYTYLSGNTWLQGLLTDNVNLNQTCNAYWNGSTLNFFRSGGGCNNTGELPGVSLHEWGHGMDSNDGNGASPNGGTGEGYGDTAAFLQTHQSCLGGGFLGSNCGGYGNGCTNCTGVREADYMLHHIQTPATPLGFNQVQCGSATCVGPCNKECHCEDAPIIQANWDLAVRDLTAAPYNLDVSTAWQYLDRFWYASRSTATSAFVCGNNNSNATGNLFNVYRVVDDCDGNLTNGTPHAAAIWAAFSRHQIGNSAAVNTDNNCTCATLGKAVVNGVNSNGSNTLTWSAVAGAASYDLYRNETSCDAGYTKIVNQAGTSYTDTNVFNGVTYYYRVQAKGTGSCPPGPMSECFTLTPANCTTPGTPTMGTLTTPANNQIQVSWTAGTPAPTSYTIYRSTGACPGGTFTVVRTGQTASPWVDAAVSGGTVYSYTVMGVTGACQSYRSACASITATGPCTLAPTFAGITGVSNPAGATCGLTLAWSAGTANCAGPLTYSIYRSTTSPFTPGAGNRIASGVTGTTYTDTDTLVFGTTYYYIIRAYDTAAAIEDGNTVTKSGTPGPLGNVVGFFDNFETGTGLGQWTASCPVAPCGSLADVRGMQACSPTQSGTRIFRWGGGPSCTANYASSVNSLFYKAVAIPAAATNVRLSFWHRYNFSYTGSAGDGCFIRLSKDAVSLYYIPPTIIGAYIQNPPTVTLTYGTSTRTMWAGTQSTMINTIVNLDEACWGTFGASAADTAAGNTTFPGQIVIAFNGYTDALTNNVGWFVDDVQVTYDLPQTCTTATPGPPVVPSGAGGKTPMTATKGVSDGSTINLAWDTTCKSGTDRYKVLYGYANQLPAAYTGAYGLTGSVCLSGGNPITASPLSWTSVPTVDPATQKFLWWVMVESDTTGNNEGSWGLNSGPNERTGPGTGGSSGQCGTTTKVLGNTCGQ